MLGSIKGTITWKNEKYLLVENAGLGYRIYTTNNTFLESEIGQSVYFFLHTHVREDAFDLYGFPSVSELSFFELLISVSGIGPKGALGILSVVSVDTLKHAIKSNDTSYLTKISGIGKKTAEKIALELRDKLDDISSTDSVHTSDLDVLEALKALGYREGDIREVLRNLESNEDTSSKIKQALKLLGNK